MFVQGAITSSNKTLLSSQIVQEELIQTNENNLRTFSTDRNLKIYQYCIEQGLLNAKAEPTEKLINLKFPPLPASMVLDLHRMIHQPFPIAVQNHIINYSIGRLILDFKITFPQIYIDFSKLLGSFVAYFLLSQNKRYLSEDQSQKEYLRLLFETNKIDFPEEFYSLISVPYPNDRDLRLELNSGQLVIEKSELEVFKNWVFNNLAYYYAPPYIKGLAEVSPSEAPALIEDYYKKMKQRVQQEETKNKNSQDVKIKKIPTLFPSTILQHLPESIVSKPFDNGVTKTLTVNFINSPVELIFSFALGRQTAFFTDDVFIPLDQLIFNPNLSIDHIKKLQIIPQSHSKMGPYGLILHTIKKIKANDFNTLNYQIWFKGVCAYLNGYSFVDDHFEEDRFEVLSKFCKFNENFNEIQNFSPTSAWIEEFIMFTKKHCPLACQKVAFFINCLNFLNRHLSLNDIYKICGNSACKDYFQLAFKDFKPSTEDEKTLFDLYELLFINKIGFEQVEELLHTLNFLSFTSNQPDIELIDHENTHALYQKRLQITGRNHNEMEYVYINLFSKEVNLSIQNDTFNKIENKIFDLFLRDHKSENYIANSQKLEKLKLSQSYKLGESIGEVAKTNGFLATLAKLVAQRDLTSEAFIKAYFAHSMNGYPLIKSVILRLFSESILSDTFEVLSKLTPKELISKILNFLCYSSDTKLRALGLELLKQMTIYPDKEGLKTFIDEIEDKFPNHLDVATSIVIELYDAQMLNFQQVFTYFTRFCQSGQKLLKDRDLKYFSHSELAAFTSFVEKVKVNIHLIDPIKKNYTCIIWTVKRLVEENLIDSAENLLLATQKAEKIPLLSSEINMGWSLILQAKLKNGHNANEIFSIWKNLVESKQIAKEFTSFVLDLLETFKKEEIREDLHELFDFLNSQSIAFPSDAQEKFAGEILTYQKTKVKAHALSPSNMTYHSLSKKLQLEVELFKLQQEVGEKNYTLTLESLNHLFVYKDQFTEDIYTTIINALNSFDTLSNIISALKVVDVSKLNNDCLFFIFQNALKNSIEDAELFLSEALIHKKLTSQSAELTESFYNIYEVSLNKEKATIVFSRWKKRVVSQDILLLPHPFLSTLYDKLKNQEGASGIDLFLEFVDAQKFPLSNDFVANLQTDLIAYFQRKIKREKFSTQCSTFKSLTVSSKLNIENFIFNTLLEQKKYEKARKILEKHQNLNSSFSPEYVSVFKESVSKYIKMCSKISEEEFEICYSLFLNVRKLKLWNAQEETLQILELLDSLQSLTLSKTEANLIELLTDIFFLINKDYENLKSDEKNEYHSLFLRIAKAATLALSKYPVIELSPYMLQRNSLNNLLTNLLILVKDQKEISKELAKQLQLKFLTLPQNFLFAKVWLGIIENCILNSDNLLATQLWYFIKKMGPDQFEGLAPVLSKIINLLINQWAEEKSCISKIIVELEFLKTLNIDNQFIDYIKERVIGIYKSPESDYKNFKSEPPRDRLNLLEAIYNLNGTETLNKDIIELFNKVLKEIYDISAEKFIEFVSRSLFIKSWPEKDLKKLVAGYVFFLASQSAIQTGAQALIKTLTSASLIPHKESKNEFREPALLAFDLMKAFPQCIDKDHESVWYDVCYSLFKANLYDMWGVFCYIQEHFILSDNASVSLWLKTTELLRRLSHSQLLQIWKEKKYLPVLTLMTTEETVIFKMHLYSGVIGLARNKDNLKTNSEFQQALIQETTLFIESLKPVEYADVDHFKTSSGDLEIPKDAFLLFGNCEIPSLDNVSLMSALSTGKAKLFKGGNERQIGYLTIELLSYKLTIPDQFAEGYEGLAKFFDLPHSIFVWEKAYVLLQALQLNRDLDSKDFYSDLISLSTIIPFENLNYPDYIVYLTNICTNYSLKVSVTLLKQSLDYSLLKYDKASWNMIKNLVERISSIDPLQERWIVDLSKDLYETFKLFEGKFFLENFKIDYELCQLILSFKCLFKLSYENQKTYFSYLTNFINSEKNNFTDQYYDTFFIKMIEYFNKVMVTNLAGGIDFYEKNFKILLLTITNSKLVYEKKAQLLNLVMSNFLLVNEINALTHNKIYYEKIMEQLLDGSKTLMEYAAKPLLVRESYLLYCHLLSHYPVKQKLRDEYNIILNSNRSLVKNVTTLSIQNKKNNANKKAPLVIDNQKNIKNTTQNFITYMLEESSDINIKKAIHFIAYDEKRFLKENNLMIAYGTLIDAITIKPLEVNVFSLLEELSDYMFEDLRRLGLLKDTGVSKICSEIRTYLINSIKKRISLFPEKYPSKKFIDIIHENRILRDLCKMLSIILYRNISCHYYFNEVSHFFEEFKISAVLIEILCRFFKDVDQFDSESKVAGNDKKDTIWVELGNVLVGIDNKVLLKEAESMIDANDIKSWEMHEATLGFCDLLTTLSIENLEQLVLEGYNFVMTDKFNLINCLKNSNEQLPSMPSVDQE